MNLGTVVKITSTITVADGSDPDSAKVTITNPSGTAVVNAADMTSDGNGVFSYIYQSDVDGVSGVYEVLVAAVKSSYTARSKDLFKLN